jgi:DNA-binding MarR family transcriptional regulator
MQESPPTVPIANVREATTLLRDILDLGGEFEDALGSELTVNRTDFEAMQQLIRRGALSPSEIARQLGVSTAAATIIVDRLVAVGHVTRKPHPTDRRAILVVPEPTSIERALGRLLPLVMGIEHLLDDFSPDEQEVITEYLRRVQSKYREQLDAAQSAAT